MALPDQMEAQRLDEGRLADTGHAGDAEPEGLAGVRQQRREQFVGLGAVIGARGFEQRDRLGDGAALNLRMVAQNPTQHRGRSL